MSDIFHVGCPSTCGEELEETKITFKASASGSKISPTPQDVDSTWRQGLLKRYPSGPVLEV